MATKIDVNQDPTMYFFLAVCDTINNIFVKRKQIEDQLYN